MKELEQAFKMRKFIARDKIGYFESVEKRDTDVLKQVIENDSGKGTVIRLFLGATTEMPSRAITYAMSALRLSQLVNCEQVQIIGVTTLGAKINGTPKSESSKQFKNFARMTSHIVGKKMPDALSKTVFAEDVDCDIPGEITEAVSNFFITNKEVAKSLQTKGDKRAADAISYTAAHIAFQDTGLLEFEPVKDGPEVVNSDTIISVGCQQEKQFHTVRIGATALLNQSLVLPSVQVFTMHSTPPYFMARYGEQALDEAIKTRNLDFNPTDAQARKDMQHFEPLLNLRSH